MATTTGITDFLRFKHQSPSEFVMKKLVRVLPATIVLLLVANPAFALAPDGAMGDVAMAAGLAIGIAAAGGAIGQGRAAAAALEGIARNPQASGKLFTPMIIGLALIESLVIYALLIAFQLAGAVTG
jgi:F-type H+-transporting ATPase subunit c